jgi:transposase
VHLAEIGVDMTRFPTAAHLASWAGMCPGNIITGGKRRSGTTTKGSRWLGEILHGDWARTSQLRACDYSSVVTHWLFTP